MRITASPRAPQSVEGGLPAGPLAAPVGRATPRPRRVGGGGCASCSASSSQGAGAGRADAHGPASPVGGRLVPCSWSARGCGGGHAAPRMPLRGREVGQTGGGDEAEGGGGGARTRRGQRRRGRHCTPQASPVLARRCADVATRQKPSRQERRRAVISGGPFQGVPVGAWQGRPRPRDYRARGGARGGQPAARGPSCTLGVFRSTSTFLSTIGHR